MNCGKCGGPTIQLFTSLVCKNECDILNQNDLQKFYSSWKLITLPEDDLWDDFGDAQYYVDENGRAAFACDFEERLDKLSLEQNMNIISLFCFGENYKQEHTQYFKRMVKK